MPKLPSPPSDQQSFMANLLSNVKSYFDGSRDVSPSALYSDPIAQARITRTPIYQHQPADWDAARGGYYQMSFNPWGPGSIHMLDRDLQGSVNDNQTNRVIPHESAHAIYNKAGLFPKSAQMLSGPAMPDDSMAQITGSPNLYPLDSLDPKRRDALVATEGLSYSIGNPDATPFIEHVARQISDPVLAQQLLRLHQNALMTRIAKEKLASESVTK